jgi:hypothetical protein
MRWPSARRPAAGPSRPPRRRPHRQLAEVDITVLQHLHKDPGRFGPDLVSGHPREPVRLMVIVALDKAVVPDS